MKKKVFKKGFFNWFSNTIPGVKYSPQSGPSEAAGIELKGGHYAAGKPPVYVSLPC